MGNLLQYTNKSKTIDKKLAALLAQIQYDYNNGFIRTETEYYYRIKMMLSEFYKSLIKPTFRYRPAITTPMSDEYNAMITESYNDMEFIIKDCEALNNLVSQSFIDAQLGRTMLSNEIAYLSKKVSTIQQSIAKNQSPGTVIFTELFNDTDSTGNLGSENSLFVDSDNGILTLKRSSAIKNNVKNIYIDSEFSNGFPGNTHCVDSLNGNLHFIGQEGLHNDINAIIDKQVDSWFEFELFSITDETRRACNSFGFEYDEGVSWINNDDVLRMKLVIVPEIVKNCSWITISPYLSDVKGVKECLLEKCEIITASNNVYCVANNLPFNETLVFPFPPQQIRQIEFTFVQSSKYKTKVGHFYYTSADTTNMSIFQNFDYSDQYARIDGPKPSVSLLGCKYNPTIQWVEYPTNKTEYQQNNYAKNGLFNMPPSTVNRKSNQEMIDAYRYMIGIKDIKVFSCVFAREGQYISKSFITDDVITSISLEADEYIPGTDPEILQYAITLDGGITWHKIYPMHRAYMGIYRYYVNNDTIDNMLAFDTKDKRSRNLTVPGEARSVRLKIYMKRPIDVEVNDKTEVKDLATAKTKEYATPIVYQYKLRVTTGGDTIEY